MKNTHACGSRQILCPHSPLYTHWLHITHIYMQVGEKRTLANDVHRIASKVWTGVGITHLSFHTSLFLLHFQLYIYLCSWVMRWAPICYWSQPRSDRNSTSSLSHYQPPHPLFPFPSPLLEAYVNALFPVIVCPFDGQVLFFQSWWQDDRLKMDK